MKVAQRPIKPSADRQQRQVRAPPKPPNNPPSAPAPAAAPAPPGLPARTPGGGNGVLRKRDSDWSIVVRFEGWTYRGPYIFSLWDG